MKVTKEAIEVLVVDSLFAGKSQQQVEDDIKLLLKQKAIDVDDYSNAMEIIYKENK